MNVRLIRPVDGVRDFQGELLSFENGEIALLLDDEIEMKFQKSEAAYVRLVDDFDYSMAEIEE